MAVVSLFDADFARAGPAATTLPSVSATGDIVADFVAEASQRFGIPASWIRAVMRIESAGDVRALSPKGAIGLMQIMPQTWADLRLRYGLGADPFDAHDNILAGAAYLRELHDRFGSPGFLAAYNAGPARYEDFLATGRPLPDETRAYVAALAPMVGDGSIDRWPVVAVVARSWAEAQLFVTYAAAAVAKSRASQGSLPVQTPAGSSVATTATLATQSDGLFVRTTPTNPQP